MRQGLKWISFVVLLSLVTGWWLYSPQNSDFELSGDGCLVLAYHRIIPGPLPVIDWFGALDDYTLYRNDFQKEMRSLKALGVHFITPQQLEGIVRRQMAPPEKCVLVTLDDADISQYQEAFPVFKQEQIPFTLFVITGQVGAHNFNGLEMATWPQIREMIASGLASVGSHTHNLHTQDSSGQPLFVRADKVQEFADDLQASILTIQQETHATPLYFAYPYGFGTPKTDEAALRLGMRLVFSLRPGIEHPGDPSFYVKRLMVTERSWSSALRWASRASGAENKGR